MKTFDQIVKLVQEHHQPLPLFIVQRYNFNMRLSQAEGESISAFIANLRQLSEHCKYETTLEDMLRDRLVCRIRDKRIQQHLLAEPDLTFSKAREIALAAETATCSYHNLQANKTPIMTAESLLKIQSQKKGKRACKDAIEATACYCCGGNHSQKDC